MHRRNVTAVCALVLALRVGSAQGQLHPKPSRDPIAARWLRILLSSSRPYAVAIRAQTSARDVTP